MSGVDLRKLNRATLDVYLRSFSSWCWEGWCQRMSLGPTECRVECECSCHET